MPAAAALAQAAVLFGCGGQIGVKGVQKDMQAKAVTNRVQLLHDPHRWHADRLPEGAPVKLNVQWRCCTDGVRQ